MYSTVHIDKMNDVMMTKRGLVTSFILSLYAVLYTLYAPL
jgi:hypothetical protein